MARRRIFAVLAAAAFSVGVNAGPCKPYSSVALSSTIIETAASTITTETSQATDSTEVLATTLTETATGSIEATISIEPTITTEAATTLATITLATPTAEATTTSAEAPPACEPIQILVNPSFDDNNDASPWTLGAGVTVSQVNPRPQPNFLYNTMTVGSTSTTFSQTLPPLGNFPYQLDYYFNIQTAINGRAFSCSVVPSINGQLLQPSQRFTGDGSTDDATLSFTVSCTGTYNTVIIGADDFSLQRVCDT
ncbi:hypothetical protein KAF25_007794 [Fusarium avenaceum]|uniref:Uncharacterized protein n=1 Tax=Fusarium avenaceum TaxID=40199 RepID=A0A9P7KLS7_9HYPO|nr:hypothetical protein KAF25_007794 [Fusarium avenaceum]